MIGMQLPQHIIDLVGNLFDEGMDDETICRAVLKAWEIHKESPRRSAFGNDAPAGASFNIQAYLEDYSVKTLITEVSHK